MDTFPWQRSGQWYCLLWKDFMQVRSTLIAVAGGGLAMQLLLLVAERWFNDAEPVVAMIAFIAPILFAIGACGMLVGHERQSGSWEWSSSIPVSWRSALTSKLLITLAGGIVTCIVLAVIPVVLLLPGRLPIDKISLIVFSMSGMIIVALLEVVAYFFLASLLIRETLTALVIAGLGLSVAQLAITAMSLAIASNRLVRWGLTPDFASFFITFVSSLGILAIGMVAMLIAFHWRWTTGQRTVFQFRANAPAAVAPSAAYVYSTTEGPASWRVLIKLASVSSLWLQLSAAALASLVFFKFWGITVEFLVLPAGILGLSAFQGDQAHQRYHFLADRGVAPWKLVLSRLGVASAWMLGLWCTMLYSPLAFAAVRWMPTTMLCWLAFLVSALAAICFRKPVVAMTVATVAFIGALMGYVPAVHYGMERSRQLGLWLDYESLTKLAQLWSPLAMLVLLVVIFRAARRWIVYDGLHLPIYFVVAVVVAFVLQIVGIIITLYALLPASTPIAP